MNLTYGAYTVQTGGNGFTALIKRPADTAEVFMRGDDAAEFLDGLEALTILGASAELTDSFISDYFPDY